MLTLGTTVGYAGGCNWIKLPALPQGTHIIPVGATCTPAALLRGMTIRKQALPFDWLVSSPEAVSYYLQKLLLQTHTDREWTRFLKDFLDVRDTGSNLPLSRVGPSNCNLKDSHRGNSFILHHCRFEQLLFMHEQQHLRNGDVAGLREKYKRRFQRLKDILLARESRHIILFFITPHGLGEARWATETVKEQLQKHEDHDDQLQNMRELIISARKANSAPAETVSRESVACSQTCNVYVLALNYNLLSASRAIPLLLFWGWTLQRR
eukprot:gnl/TRDRNA2_/TRDRNA2_65277_c0_seq1.p1 gnl/TRDRNA2_/TRDRNA2_65277_c0~~gnl/TRDRNA2_/TRDRNA2_65277_c0_seq1.p1  ORF type:complete len:277 (+),score=17.18 gnl/TRDRNA2_/TRDRNA2_65277_c0_seq1:35-832(+)